MKTTTLFLVLGAAMMVAGCGDGTVTPGDPSTIRGRTGEGGDVGAAGSAGSGAGGAAGGGGATSGAGGQGGAGPTTCPAYQALCNGTCIDITVVAHCGYCNNACAAGASCTNGVCVGGTATGGTGGYLTGSGGMAGNGGAGGAIDPPACSVVITQVVACDKANPGLNCNTCSPYPSQLPCLAPDRSLCVASCSDCH